MGHIYFILGISGSGKSTLINNIKNLNLENTHTPLSYKTRPPRSYERDGVDAHFIDEDTFKKSIENHEFLEYAVVHNTGYYGTKYQDVIDEGIDKGKIIIKELDILGLKRLKKEGKIDKGDYTTIYLYLDETKLINRLKSRGDDLDSDYLQNRINSAISENKESREICDYIIDAGNNPNQVLKDFLDIINK